jgi:Holliday junction resolvase RusA-like endonuclease
MTVEFYVPGIPAPGGSKKAFAYVGRDGRPHANVVDDAKRNAPWRSSVAYEARRAHMGQEPLHGPLQLLVTFYLPRPKDHFGSGKNAGSMKRTAPHLHAKKPDLTKLVRALEDAMTGIVWHDDAQVCEQQIRKRYGAAAGAKVRVEQMDEGDLVGLPS